METRETVQGLCLHYFLKLHVNLQLHPFKNVLFPQRDFIMLVLLSTTLELLPLKSGIDKDTHDHVI